MNKLAKSAAALILLSSAAVLGATQPIEQPAAGFAQPAKVLLGASQTASYDEGVVRVPETTVRVPGSSSRHETAKKWTCHPWQESKVGGFYQMCEWK